MESKERLEDEFYGKQLYHSYSSLSKLAYSPGFFYKEYVLKDKEPEEPGFLSEGKLIHNFILDKENFSDKFILSPIKLPSKTIMRIQERLYRELKADFGEDAIKPSIRQYNERILEIMADMNMYQRLLLDAKRIDKAADTDGTAYWEFICKRKGRVIVDLDMVDRATIYAEKIKESKVARELLRMDHAVDNIDTDEVVVLNEQDFSFNLPGLSIGIKGVWDNIVIDKTQKKLWINDIKSSGKPLSVFADTVETWKYWMQDSMYRLGAACFLKESGYDVSEWTIISHFIVVDIYKQVYCFPISEATKTLWDARTNEHLKAADWHFTNRNYSMPIGCIKNEVYL